MARYRVLRLCLNLDRPADRRIAEGVDRYRGAVSVADFLREAITTCLALSERHERWEILPDGGAGRPVPPPPDVPASTSGSEGEIDVFDMAIHRGASGRDAGNTGERSR